MWPPLRNDSDASCLQSDREAFARISISKNWSVVLDYRQASHPKPPLSTLIDRAGHDRSILLETDRSLL